MCSRVTCPRCKKYTWSGCGQHVQQALAGLRPDQICDCGSKPASEDKGKLSKLFGR